MPNYVITFYRADKKQHDSKPQRAKTMQEAVIQTLEKANKNNVQICGIAVNIEGETHKQRFCDECLTSMACYGIRDKWYCSQCIRNENND